MRIIITGGGGFLGSRLCDALLQREQLTGPSGQPESIDQIALFDARFHRSSEDDRVQQVTGDISDRDNVFDLVGNREDTAIFHLASMVSGECEEHFDAALAVNLDGGRHLFEAVRTLPGRPRLVFASSIGTYGGEGMVPVNSDLTKQTPQTTYGVTKAICELLLNDYSRKGYFDGRSVRLPTVIIRPGKPNAAASSWASGMFREPLQGEDCLLPINRDQRHPITSYRTAIASFIALHEVPATALGSDRAFVLPAHTITPRLAEAALQEVAAERGLQLGTIQDAFDPHIQGIVDNWSQAIDGSRALALGIPQPPALKQILLDFFDDYGPA
ncbi:NAD-dependent epimerase/dehydratase family protein [Opitutaceae bacterium]|nr:NAD-dependent epimerase/dehydratase family protein [Opitutaceae bacterium]